MGYQSSVKSHDAITITFTHYTFFGQMEVHKLCLWSCHHKFTLKAPDHQITILLPDLMHESNNLEHNNYKEIAFAYLPFISVTSNSDDHWVVTFFFYLKAPRVTCYPITGPECERHLCREAGRFCEAVQLQFSGCLQCWWCNLYPEIDLWQSCITNRGLYWKTWIFRLWRV